MGRDPGGAFKGKTGNLRVLEGKWRSVQREEVLSNARLTGLRDEDQGDPGIAERGVLSSKGEVHGVMRSEWNQWLWVASITYTCKRDYSIY